MAFGIIRIFRSCALLGFVRNPHVSKNFASSRYGCHCTAGCSFPRRLAQSRYPDVAHVQVALATRTLARHFADELAESAMTLSIATRGVSRNGCATSIFPAACDPHVHDCRKVEIFYIDCRIVSPPAVAAGEIELRFLLGDPHASANLDKQRQFVRWQP